VHLALGQHGVQDPATVVHGDVAEEPRLPGLGVDLRDGDVRAEGIGRLPRPEPIRRREPRLHPLREPGGVGGGRGELPPREPGARDPGHGEPAVVELRDVLHRHLEEVCGEAPGLLQDVLRRVPHGGAPKL